MKIRQFLEHHGIARNPFAEEDAQTDPVFKDHCIDSTYHPTWDKIYGDPREPSTSIVFGEKGAGKTAIRLQIARHLQQHNRQNPEQRLFVIHYDDFNPFLDRFREKLSGRRRRRADRVLKEWKLWDHMDAILSLGVTGLVDRMLDIKQPNSSVDCDLGPEAIGELDRHQSRDLLLLAGCYDQSIATTFKDRWQRLRKRLRFGTLLAKWTVALGVGVSAGLLNKAPARAVNGTFNMISVDGDTSPSDSAIIMANGLSGLEVVEGTDSAAAFQEALTQVCLDMAKAIARDGEGATRLIEVTVEGALNRDEAARAARVITSSPLVKTAIHGCDPNWGRILCAAGRSEIELDQDRADVYLAGEPVLRAGVPISFDKAKLKAKLSGKEIRIRVCLNIGQGTATAWGCDLSKDYVSINADYTT